jgi:hypothetical protein
MENHMHKRKTDHLSAAAVGLTLVSLVAGLGCANLNKKVAPSLQHNSISINQTSSIAKAPVSNSLNTKASTTGFGGHLVGTCRWPDGL